MGGLFLTFEGLDGSGKSTHLRRAADWLASEGVPVCVTREPGGTELGQALREVFLDRRWGQLDGLVEAMVVFASRRQHLLEVIEPALAAGQTVFCDRFTDSTLVYQGVARGADLTALESLDRLATGARVPDGTLLFDLPADAARNRGASSARASAGEIDRLDAEGLDFYDRVRRGYLDLAARSPERFAIVDSSGTLDETWTAVHRALKARWSLGGAS